MNSIRTFLKTNFILLFAVAILLATTVFVGYKNAKIDLFFSDAISDNILLEAPFKQHDIEIQAIHTHLLKWPVVLLENALGFSELTHIIVSILLLVAMNAWIGYLIYLFARKNKFATALALLLLASIELLTGISANEGTLTMITIRNIEIPLVITLLLLSLRQKRIVSIAGAVIALLWGIVFVTDQLLLYSTIIGAALYIAFDCFRRKDYRLNKIQNIPTYIYILVGAILYKVISIGFAKIGIANFYSRSNDGLTWADSFTHLLVNTSNYIGKMFDVFGAGIFGQQIFSAPVFLLNISVLITVIFLTVRFIKKYKSAKNVDDHQKTIALLFAMYFFAMLIFTLLIPRELGGRYFAFVPVIGLLLIAYELRDWKPKFKKRKNANYVILAMVIGVTGLFLYMGSMANDIFYRQKYSSLVERQGNLDKLIDSLKTNEVGVYIDQDYWRNHIVKYQFNTRTGLPLDTPLVYCGEKVVDKQFSRKSWSEPDGSNSAIRVNECDKKAIENIFGEPDEIIELSDDKKDTLFIYKHDVRDILDLKEYEPDFIKP